VYFVPN